MKLKDIKSKADIIDLLRLKEKELNYLLYSRKKKYKVFYTKKKDGSLRKISSPCRQLKYVQSVLKNELESIYKAPSCVCGFVKGRSIVCNALVHKNKKYVLNLDIKDFFPSITFKRIHGLLMKEPIGLDYKTSIMLANLLVDDEKVLPQGSPSSPIISNMICKRLDRELVQLSRRYGAVYSRYADDVTFSWNEAYTTSKLIKGGMPEGLSEKIIDIFHKNGFAINPKKVRLSSSFQHQEVTGIKTNEDLNLSRFYYYKVRSMLHSWERFGLSDAYKAMCEREGTKFFEKDKERYSKVVSGLISYYGMVRKTNEEKSELTPYQSLCLRYNKLVNKNVFKPSFPPELIKDRCAVIVKYEKDTIILGTAFRINRYFLTAKHCLFEDGEEVDKKRVFSIIHQNGHSYPATIHYVSEKYDFGLLCDEENVGNVFVSNASRTAKVEDSITVLGYPDAEEGDKCSIIHGKITGYLRREGNEYLTTDAPIVTGNSGGPVLNDKNELVGLCVLGFGTADPSRGRNGILSIEKIISDYKKNTGKDLFGTKES